MCGQWVKQVKKFRMDGLVMMMGEQANSRSQV